MGHQGFETKRAESDAIGVLTRDSSVDVAAFVEVDVIERGIVPVCEEVGEALVG